MEGSDYLFTCAEVAAALAGFSALVVAISGQGASTLSPLSRGLVSSLIERSLFAVFFSLVPVLLAGLELGPSRTWLVCSVSLAAYILSLAWRSSAVRRAAPEQRELVPGHAFAITMAGGLAVLVLQVGNAFGIGVQQSVWWYLAGLTWLLASVAYLFYFGVRQWARAA